MTMKLNKVTGENVLNIETASVTQVCDLSGKRSDDTIELPKTADGRTIIRSRKALNNSTQLFDPKRNIVDENVSLPKDDDGHVIIKRRKSTPQMPSVDLQFIGDEMFDEKTSKKKHKHKKKNNGKKKQPKYYRDLKPKKKKAKQEKKLQRLKEEYVEKRKPNLPAILSELISSKELFAVYNNKMYIYSDTEHCFVKCDSRSVQVMLMKLLSNSERLCVTQRDVKNAYDTMLVLPELQRDLSPIINKPLVNCENGVLDLEAMTLLKHDPRYGFTRCIKANYDEAAKGKVFEKWLDETTKGDEEIKNLLQEVVGYALSEYVFAKVAFLFFGVQDSGKSVFLRIISRIVGEEHISNVDMQKLSEPCYAAQLSDAKLNIAPDVPEKPMKDIGTFKSIVSSLDTIETKELYENPKSQPCFCKLIFGANQFIPLGKLDAINIDAFFRRILIVPFLFSKPREEQDLHLDEKLWKERDYIFTWAMKGAKRLMNNNFVFTRSKVSDALWTKYKTRYSPEKCFFEEHLRLSKGSIISAEVVQEAYEEYADKAEAKTGRNDMKNFISKHYPKVKHKRKRINGSKNPLAVYEGLAFAD